MSAQLASNSEQIEFWNGDAGKRWVAQQVRLDATVMAYADSFWILGVCILLSLATLLILRKPQPGAVAMADAH